MATPTPKPSAKEAAKKAVAAKKVAVKKKAFYGFDGMRGQTGPEAKLKGK